MTKRLFIGVPIESETVEQAVKNWKKDPLTKGSLLNWVKPENWHITLFFLGDTPKSVIPLLKQSIEISFCSVQPFNTQMMGAGVFPHRRNPKVLWLGLENLQTLMPACSLMGELLLKNGLIPCYKPLKPHLTLARINNLRHSASFESFLNQSLPLNFGSVAINRVVLYESILKPEGPVYKPLFVKVLEIGQSESS